MIIVLIQQCIVKNKLQPVLIFNSYNFKSIHFNLYLTSSQLSFWSSFFWRFPTSVCSLGVFLLVTAIFSIGVGDVQLCYISQIPRLNITNDLY